MTGTDSPSVCGASDPGPASGSDVVVVRSPSITVSASVVRFSTATPPPSSVEIVRSWLGEATVVVLTSLGPAGPPAPAPPPASGAPEGNGAAVIAETVP